MTESPKTDSTVVDSSEGSKCALPIAAAALVAASAGGAYFFLKKRRENPEPPAFSDN